MKKNKSNLDERQEQALLKIEHNGCWLAFAGLLIAILVQTILNGFDFKAMAGEWIVLMVLCFYMVIACLRNGIWDRRLQANFGTNLVVSLITGAVFGLVIFLMLYRIFENKPAGAIAGGVLSGVFAFGVCLLTLSVFSAVYRRKQRKLEAEEETM